MRLDVFIIHFLYTLSDHLVIKNAKNFFSKAKIFLQAEFVVAGHFQLL